ncbi:MAG TPA: hypothetical protein VK919_08390 [Solirubrobacterales bacterium]|nr:hypothetical protein [Solirubrobacterales bacterium]
MITIADAVAIELASPEGEAVRVEWDPGALDRDRLHDLSTPTWTLSGEVDWDEIEALRIVSAAIPDGRAVALVALRPAGAAGHGDDVVAAAIVADADATEIDEPLLSVETDADGMPARIALELRFGSETIPLRVAGDVTRSARDSHAGVELVRAELEVRLDGKRSAGTFDVLGADTGAAR